MVIKMNDQDNNKIGFVVKNDDNAIKSSLILEKWFNQRGIEIIRKKGFSVSEKSVETDFLCIFVLGGDGTFLSASRWAGLKPSPMIGVKFGEVGFLAEITEDQIFQAAEAIINGNYTVQHRIRLEIRLIRNGETIISENVLNDVVINKRSIARLARIKTIVNDFSLTTYTGDGLIIATPTGSTAYSMAAGGPIIHPYVPCIIMTPICPFTLTNRPLILPEFSKIILEPEERSSELILTLDGQEGINIIAGDIIHIEKAIHPVPMIMLSGNEYFDVLKKKLRWSGGRI